MYVFLRQYLSRLGNVYYMNYFSIILIISFEIIGELPSTKVSELVGEKKGNFRAVNQELPRRFS